MGEVARRIVHACGVGLPALFLLDFISWGEFRALLLGISLVTIFLEVLRLRFGLQEAWLFQKLTRDYETRGLAGYALYLFSITGVALLFDRWIALPAMLMLMLGDPVSGLLGTGELRSVKATVSLVSMFLVCLTVAVPFTVNEIGPIEWALFVAASGALLATIADGIKPVIAGYVIDDNLTIPLAGAVGIWATYGVVPI